MEPTNLIAIIPDEHSDAVLVPREDALELLALYDRHEVTHEEDVQLYGALKLALGDIGKKELVYSTGEETWAARKLREWREPRGL